jgi:hypothetical protein
MSVQISPEDHTRRFLKLLDPDVEDFCFRAFPDHKGSEIKPKNYDGTPHQVRPLLEKVNRAGGGVFVVVNEGGQRTADITRVRAVFADTDGAPLEPLVQALKPHMVIESSPGRWHVYWLVASDFPLNQFGPVQSAIAVKFGTDCSVRDLPRVMRLPGFYHNKGNPHLCSLQEISAQLPRYRLDEVVNGLGLKLYKSPNKKTSPTLETQSLVGQISMQEVERALAFLNPFVPQSAWVGNILALAHDYGEGGRELAHRWSRGDLWIGGRDGA